MTYQEATGLHCFMYHLGTVYAKDELTADRIALENNLMDRSVMKQCLEDQASAYDKRDDPRFRKLAMHIRLNNW